MTNHTYKLIELTGTSVTSVEDAVASALAKAGQSVRNMHWFTIQETRGTIIGDKVGQWQVTIKVGFTLED